jgi:RND superfamily putative drug exporter
MRCLTRWVLTHKLVVVLAWLVLTVAGGVAAGSLGGALSKDFSVAGRAARVNARISRQFGSGGNAGPVVAVVRLPAGATVDQPAPRAQLAAAFGRLAASAPGSRVASLFSTGGHAFVSADGRTTFALIYTRTARDPENQSSLRGIQAAASALRVEGAPVDVTGMQALVNTGTKQKGTGLLVATLIGALGALAVLAFVFASFLAFVPLMTAVVAILTTMLITRGLAAVTSVSFIIEFLIGLIGLGVAIDYALLIIVRWREERAKGLGNEDAIEAAMLSAGRAVAFSGATVAVGLLALVVLPVPFLRSVGFGGMLIPLVSVAVALTLLPVILATVGPRMDWPRLRREDRPSRAWSAWGRLVCRHRIPAAASGLAVLVALLIAATGIHLGISSPDSESGSGAAHNGLVALEHSGLGAGTIAPIEVLTPAGDVPQTAAHLARVTGVRAVVAPQGVAWRRAGTAVLDVLPQADPSTSAGDAVVNRLRSMDRASIQVGGAAAQNAEFVDSVYGSFPLMICLIALATFVLLARAFRSILLPLKAVALNVVSVAAAWGAITLVWQDGHGSQALWGIPATGQISSWLPMMMFAFLFGLSMDYEVFILARTREEYDATGNTTEAAVRGIARTGRLVTSAALILFLSFVSMSSTPQTDVKVLATGLGVGILLDATVVRALLVPALVSLFGRWNWWMPALPARLLGVHPSQPAVEVSPAPAPAA